MTYKATGVSFYSIFLICNGQLRGVQLANPGGIPHFKVSCLEL